jgi:hypothetical protein
MAANPSQSRVSEKTLLLLVDFVADLQRQIFVLRQAVTTNKLVSPEALEALEQKAESSFASEKTLLFLVDLITDLQRELFVLRHVKTRKKSVSSEALNELNVKAESRVGPLRQRILDAIDAGRQIQHMEDLQSDDKVQLQ